MSDLASSRLSQSTTNKSITKRHSKTSSQSNILTNEFIEYDNRRSEYENYVITKKEKNINLNKLEILKNRINNLKQQEQKNIRQIEMLQEKEEKMKKIINEKKENKKKLEDFKKKENERFFLIKKKIQEDRHNQINSLNNSILKRKEDLNKKIINLKRNKNEIKNKINKNNNTALNINKLKYEKAKTSLIFNKDKNIITKAEKEEQKRRNRLKMMNKEKMNNISLEKDIEFLEKEEEKYLELIKQTQLIKQKLKKHSFNSNIINKTLINKSNENKDQLKTNINKRKFVRLPTDEIKKIDNNLYIRATFHKSIDINDCNKNNKNNNLSINENTNIKNVDSIIDNNIRSKSCTNRNNKNNKEKNDLQKTKILGLKQKILEKIVNIKLKPNFEN